MFPSYTQAGTGSGSIDFYSLSQLQQLPTYHVLLARSTPKISLEPNMSLLGLLPLVVEKPFGAIPTAFSSSVFHKFHSPLRPQVFRKGLE